MDKRQAWSQKTSFPQKPTFICSSFVLSLYCSHSQLWNFLTFTKTWNNKVQTQILMVDEFWMIKFWIINSMTFLSFLQFPCFKYKMNIELETLRHFCFLYYFKHPWPEHFLCPRRHTKLCIYIIISLFPFTLIIILWIKNSYYSHSIAGETELQVSWYLAHSLRY